MYLVNNIVLKNTLYLKHDIINFKNLFFKLITLNREKHGVNKQIKLDYKLKGVGLNSLAFANDFVSLAKDVRSATEQIIYWMK